MKLLFALVLPILSLVAASPTQLARQVITALDEPRFVPIEECGNRIACALADDGQLGREICNDYVGTTFVESPYCFNTVFLCSFNRVVKSCWYPVSGLKRDCNKPLQCAPDLPLVKGSSNTTEPILPTTAAPDLTDESRFVPIKECGNRKACALEEDSELGKELCSNYIEPTFIESPYCFNTVFLCSYRRAIETCWYNLSWMKRDCNSPLQCAPHLPLLRGSSNTTEPTIIVPTTTEIATTTLPASTKSTGTRFVSVEKCGNRTACAFKEDADAGAYICNNFKEPTFVESTYCFNTVYLCGNNQWLRQCWYTLDDVNSDCDIPLTCVPDLPLIKGSSITTTIAPTTTTSTTTAPTTTKAITTASTTAKPTTTTSTTTTPTTTSSTTTKPTTTIITSSTTEMAEQCSSKDQGKRIPIAGKCTSYGECSDGYYNERSCYDGYIYYEPFNMCLPGNIHACSLFG
ncbi:uncharacterized protein LOC133393246 [Anopheles gambiae]|uniref:uncharacterized protein LOC133393246 n=1 Tax=Anopheles gambiae TaxID=7165 RepID=UPI002AC8B1E6|nr:uncharacterized protein LOC133393246 [Anopheles gambiae]